MALFDRCCLIIIYGIIIITFIYFYRMFPTYIPLSPSTLSKPMISPESGNRFVPSASGSTGISPLGGMRPSFQMPEETEVGFWGFTPVPEETATFDIYDHTTPFKEYIIDIGWWNKKM